MLRIAVIFITGLALSIGYQPTPVADACGVKLTVKSPRVKKRVRRTSHPSHVLVLGRPPSKKLARWLKQAGHTVEITQNAKDTKRKDYAIVISDPEKVNEARSQFPKTRVVTRSGSLSSNVRKIERVLTKNDDTATDGETRVAAREPARTRRRARTKPAKPEEIKKAEPVETAATEPGDVAAPIRPGQNTGNGGNNATSEPKKQPDGKVATSVEDKADPQDDPDGDTESDDGDDPAESIRPKVEPKPKAGKWYAEMYFGSNRDGLSDRMQKQLRANARWLAANPSVNITIEGHTDASGPDEYNKLLGERRAEAVRAFLVEAGVDESRLEVISYGEERPKYQSSHKNRRVVLVKN